MRGPEIIKAIKREKYMKIAKFVAPVATLAFIVAGVMIFRTDSAESSEAEKNVIFSAKDMQIMSETLADFQSTQFSQKTEIDHAALSISALQDQVEELTSQVKTLSAQRDAPRLPTPEPSHSVGSVDTFVRDNSIPLPKQANNPGALNYGQRALRFGATNRFSDGAGNEVAIFPSKYRGLAALIDLIYAFDGHKIENYISGGGGIKPCLLYTSPSPRDS